LKAVERLLALDSSKKKPPAKKFSQEETERPEGEEEVDDTEFESDSEDNEGDSNEETEQETEPQNT
jgi:hypothetical protein